VEPRRKSKKVVARGLLPGARVVRGVGEKFILEFRSLDYYFV